MNSERKPMSAILKEMAFTVLTVPEGDVSPEAAAAALLLSHVAWQRANGDQFPDSAYAPALASMRRSNPYIGKEMKYRDSSKIIAELVAYKIQHHPNDKRRVFVCEVLDDKVHVEWTE